MKFFIAGALAACPVILFCQEQKPAAQTEPLHLWAGRDRAREAMAANSIVRDDPDPPRPSPYA